MPVINMSQIPDPTPPKDFSTPIPEGKYIVICENVKQKYAPNGVETWNYRLRVLEGPLGGSEDLQNIVRDRFIWDSISFGSGIHENNQKALSRAKLVISRLGGIDSAHQGEISVEPNHLEGKTCIVHVKVQHQRRFRGPSGDYVWERLDKPRNAIDFAGYEALPPGPGSDFEEDQEPLREAPVAFLQKTPPMSSWPTDEAINPDSVPF
jgi:hypothetical protein